MLAGGVNSDDHSHTFPNLVAHLREQGCYAALLQPTSFGKSPQEALNAMLCQLWGRTTRTSSWAALAAWYQDETGGDTPAPAGLGPPAHEGAERHAGEGEGEEAAAAAEEAAEAAQAEEPERAGPRLRDRRQPSAPPAVSEAQLDNRRRPVVVVVEGTEGVDVGCLRDVIRTISLGRSELPITLVLGLTTNAAALDDMLQSEISDRCMLTRHFKLVSGSLPACLALPAGCSPACRPCLPACWPFLPTLPACCDCFVSYEGQPTPPSSSADSWRVRVPGGTTPACWRPDVLPNTPLTRSPLALPCPTCSEFRPRRWPG